MPSRKRSATVRRNTQETQIRLTLVVDGKGSANVKTGIPFLDHMLVSLAKHGLFDLNLSAQGDLHVDIHHTNEDAGIVLGQAFTQALGSKQGIRGLVFSASPWTKRLSAPVSIFLGALLSSS